MDNENICWCFKRDQAELGRRAWLVTRAGCGRAPLGLARGETAGPAPDRSRDTNMPVHAWGGRFWGRVGVLRDRAVPPRGWLPLGWRWPPAMGDGHRAGSSLPEPPTRQLPLVRGGWWGAGG